MKKYKTSSGLAAKEFMLLMAAFVVIVGSIVVVLGGMSGRTKVVLGGSTQVQDASGEINIKADLDKLDGDISGL